MKQNILADKSYKFAIRIVNLYKYLVKEHNEYVLSKQILKSGTAIGAIVKESEFAQSKADFAHKLHISLKEANESQYWLLLLKDTGYLEIKLHESLDMDCEELIKILVSSIKTSKNKP